MLENCALFSHLKHSASAWTWDFRWMPPPPQGCPALLALGPVALQTPLERRFWNSLLPPAPPKSRTWALRAGETLFLVRKGMRITIFVRKTARAGFLFHPYSYHAREFLSLAPLNGK